MIMRITDEWKDEVASNDDIGDTSFSEYDWDEHKRVEKLISESPEDLDGVRELVKWYLVFKKMTSLDPRHDNSIKAPSVNFVDGVFSDKFDQVVVSRKHLRDVLNSFVKHPFFVKKDIPDAIRNSPYVENTTRFCYEYVTLQERGSQRGRDERMREKMAEHFGGGS